MLVWSWTLCPASWQASGPGTQVEMPLPRAWRPPCNGSAIPKCTGQGGVLGGGGKGCHGNAPLGKTLPTQSARCTLKDSTSSVGAQIAPPWPNPSLPGLGNQQHPGHFQQMMGHMDHNWAHAPGSPWLGRTGQEGAACAPLLSGGDFSPSQHLH